MIVFENERNAAKRLNQYDIDRLMKTVRGEAIERVSKAKLCQVFTVCDIITAVFILSSSSRHEEIAQRESVSLYVRVQLSFSLAFSLHLYFDLYLVSSAVHLSSRSLNSFACFCSGQQEGPWSAEKNQSVIIYLVYLKHLGACPSSPRCQSTGDPHHSTTSFYWR